MESHKITVDVIIPTYNSGHFLKSALDSVVRQTYPINKIFVVDDGSTDSTKDVVSNFSGIEYEYIKNSGPSKARNVGISKSSADCIAFLDADDVWEPQKIDRQIKKLQENPKAGLIYCNHTVKNTVTNTELKTDFKKKVIFSDLLVENTVIKNPSVALIPRKVLDDVGYFDEQLRYGEDWDLWMRILQKYEADFCPENLATLITHDANTTNDSSYVAYNQLFFMNKWAKEFEKAGTAFNWKEKYAYETYKGISKINYPKSISKIFSKESRRVLFPFGSIYMYILYRLPSWMWKSIKSRLGYKLPS